MSKKLLALIAALTILAVACGDDGDNGGGGNGSDDGGGGDTGGGAQVTARDFAFVPTSVEAEAGAELEITLVNSGQVTHSFTVDDADFEIEAEPGQEASGTLTVPESESIEFHCKFHPDQMTGEIVVGGTAAGGGGSNTKDSGGGGSNYDY